MNKKKILMVKNQETKKIDKYICELKPDIRCVKEFYGCIGSLGLDNLRGETTTFDLANEFQKILKSDIISFKGVSKLYKMDLEEDSCKRLLMGFLNMFYIENAGEYTREDADLDIVNTKDKKGLRIQKDIVSSIKYNTKVLADLLPINSKNELSEKNLVKRPAV